MPIVTGTVTVAFEATSGVWVSPMKYRAMMVPKFRGSVHSASLRQSLTRSPTVTTKSGCVTVASSAS